MKRGSGEGRREEEGEEKGRRQWKKEGERRKGGIVGVREKRKDYLALNPYS
jgi:hypothetical protein